MSFKYFENILGEGTNLGVETDGLILLCYK